MDWLKTCKKLLEICSIETSLRTRLEMTFDISYEQTATPLLGSGGSGVMMTSGVRKVARSDHCSVSGLAASHPSLQ